MADVQEKVSDVKENAEKTLGGNTGNVALKAAAAAAATGAATYAVRRVLSHEEHSESGNPSSSNGSGKSSRSSAILASAASTSWDAASDVLIPMAEDAAESAGKFVATHGPEFMRERIVPKFIEAFNDAK
jgi:hypothetical protein